MFCRDMINVRILWLLLQCISIVLHLDCLRYVLRNKGKTGGEERDPRFSCLNFSYFQPEVAVRKPLRDAVQFQ